MSLNPNAAPQPQRSPAVAVEIPATATYQQLLSSMMDGSAVPVDVRGANYTRGVIEHLKQLERALLNLVVPEGEWTHFAARPALDSNSTQFEALEIRALAGSLFGSSLTISLYTCCTAAPSSSSDLTKRAILSSEDSAVLAFQIARTTSREIAALDYLITSPKHPRLAYIHDLAALRCTLAKSFEHPEHFRSDQEASRCTSQPDLSLLQFGAKKALSWVQEIESALAA